MTERIVPKLSVIVLSYNGMEHLPECLGSIRDQTFQDFELIVVDNGSSDGSDAWLVNQPRIDRMIRLPANQGFCRGMNRGVEASSANLVLLLNQDLRLDTDCFRAMLDGFHHPPPDTFPVGSGQPDRPVVGVFPKVLFYSAPSFINAFGADWYESCHWRDSRVGLPDIGAFDRSETVFGSIFPAVMFERTRFQTVGAFDELFWSYCEDFDICYRSNILGYRFITAPEAKVYHKYRTSSRDATDPLWSRFWFLRNYLMVFLKNYRLSALIRHGRSIFRRYLGNGIRHAIHTRNYPELRMQLRVIGSLIKHIPHILKHRRTIQARRKYEDQPFWRTETVEDFNIYHVEGCIVLSLKSMRAGKERS